MVRNTLLEVEGCCAKLCAKIQDICAGPSPPASGERELTGRRIPTGCFITGLSGLMYAYFAVAYSEPVLRWFHTGAAAVSVFVFGVCARGKRRNEPDQATARIAFVFLSFLQHCWDQNFPREDPMHTESIA